MINIEIIKIQLESVISCIEKYCTEPAITTITKSLANALSENNYDTILFCCREIKGWYQENLNRILSNKFNNPNYHKKSVEVVKEIIQELESNEKTYREELGSLKQPTNSVLSTDKALENLLNRFHQVVIQLRDRYDNRTTLDVNDEYDVQDLLHALLKIFFDDIRPEEWTPSCGGASARQDFLLDDEKIVIETKKIRKGLDNKKLFDELSIDIARYKKHPSCKKLICFVYDPENRIKNPRGFEKDINLLTTDDLSVKACIRP